jgi:serine/threonine-protein kinase
MKTLVSTFALLAFTLTLRPAPVAADDVKIDPDRYGAIAFSPKTGKYGYSWNQASRSAAQKKALDECEADDAKVLTWVKFGWAALVIAEDNAYGFEEVHGAGATDGEAERKAMKELRKHTDAKVKTIIIVCSGDVAPKVTNK